MKRFSTLISVALLGMLLFSSCGGADSGGIAGKWKVVEASGLLSGTNKGAIYDFSADGKLMISAGILKNGTTYKITGDKLAYSVGPVNLSATIKIQGDTMTMAIDNSDQKFVLKRQ
ncbi:MAG: hypothetical protein EHM28_04820 [Spirochaetaceae bacterium]|nr:MAG: hypothetical protein EHM28_04820 [Spirochaetaceae bacterium]